MVVFDHKGILWAKIYFVDLLSQNWWFEGVFSTRTEMLNSKRSVCQLAGSSDLPSYHANTRHFLLFHPCRVNWVACADRSSRATIQAQISNPPLWSLAVGKAPTSLLSTPYRSLGPARPFQNGQVVFNQSFNSFNFDNNERV